MDPELGKRLPEMFNDLHGIENVQVKHGVYRIGKGAPESLKEAGAIQLHGLAENVVQLMQKADKPAMSKEDLNELREEMARQADEEGIEHPWIAVWARRTEA